MKRSLIIFLVFVFIFTNSAFASFMSSDNKLEILLWGVNAQEDGTYTVEMTIYDEEENEYRLSVPIVGMGEDEEPIFKSTVTIEPTVTPRILTDREKAINNFDIVLSAVNSDTSGTFSNISLGTIAYSAIVEIENLHEKNSSDQVIKQLYTCCEIISLVRTAEYSGWSSYRDQAKVLSETLDSHYSGPYAEDIEKIVIKLFGNNSDKKSSSSTSAKSRYSSLTKADKAKIIQYMEGRYTYYDNNPNKYSGSKTDQVWKDAMSKYSLSKAEVDLVWADYDAWLLYWSW